MYNTLFLAAGYGTRFQQQVPAGSKLSGLPKGLLPLNGKPLLSHWIEMGLENVHIITNNVYYNIYLQHYKVAVLNNKTNSNQERLGSIGDLHLAMKEFNLYSNALLVIASDTFFPGFNLNRFITFCSSKDSVVVLSYKIKDENVSKSGILELDESQNLVKFLEKPTLSETNSRLGCPCFYYFPESCLKLIDDFMIETKGELSKVDASGKLISWLIGKVNIIAFKLENEKLDIGDYNSYLEADEFIKTY